MSHERPPYERSYERPPYGRPQPSRPMPQRAQGQAQAHPYAQSQPQPRGGGHYSPITPDMENDATPTMPLRQATRRNATAHAMRTMDVVADTRSSYRRTSSRYTTRGRRTKKFLIGSAVSLAVVLALGGTAYGIARWVGAIGTDAPSADDPTIIALHTKGKEGDLPAVNVDTLIAGLANVSGAEGELVVFSTTKKDYAIDAEQRAALEAAIAQAEQVLHPFAAPTGTSTGEGAGTEGEGNNAGEGSTAPEGEGGDEGGGEGTPEGEGSAPTNDHEADAPRTDNIAFFAMDLERGGGVAYNLDLYVQSGQAIKGLFATFFASQFLDSAKASVDAEGAQVAAALADSADSQYESLRKRYDSAGWDAWIAGIGAKSYASSAGYYPMITARMDARAWLNVYRYLTGATYGATWLGEQLETRGTEAIVQALAVPHNVPAVRAVEDGEEGEMEEYTISLAPLGAPMTIWSFEGHKNSPSTGEFCMVESAIVLVDGHSYLICVMTGLPDGGANRDVFEDLIAACGHAVIHVEAPAVEPEPAPTGESEGEGSEGEGGEGGTDPATKPEGE